MTPNKHDERRLLAREYIEQYCLSLNNLSCEHLAVLYRTMKLSQQITADELGCAESTVRLISKPFLGGLYHVYLLAA
jgi:hypothetical protein